MKRKKNDNSTHQKKTKHMLLLTFVLICFSFGAVVLSLKFLFDTSPTLSSLTSFIKGANDNRPSSEDVSDEPWWNENFNFFKQVTISNESTSEQLLKGTVISTIFDHKGLVQEGKSLDDGSDLRIVHKQNEKYSIIDAQIASANTKKTIVQFPIFKDIQPQESDGDYFLYYDNITASKNVLGAIDQPDNTATNISLLYHIELGKEKHHPLFAWTNRLWILKNSNNMYSKLIYRVNPDKGIDTASGISYTVLKTSLSGELKRRKDGIFQAEIDTQNLDPGVWEIQAHALSEGNEIRSPKQTFYLSYPLYVVLSVDWEGYDVADSELDIMKQFSEEHDKLSFTQFFNPRIYITNEVSAQRVQVLTSWIIGRSKKGDEIGLHLHMHHDMVQASGVKVKTEPTWNNSIVNGHDVPMSAYSYNQVRKMLVWAKQQFETYNLGTPISFRAGGWFANLDTLKALNDEGFLIDSSGREYYVWGANQLQGYWKLTSTTAPYQPSTTNQNASSPSPTLDIWEYPNNGANSWFYSSEELIGRFNDNYSQKPLVQSQTLTYLTHPHQFHIDYEILTPTYDYIETFLASEDAGAVIYTTLEDAYKSR